MQQLLCKKIRKLWQYYKGIPQDNLANSEAIKLKERITGRTPADSNTKDIEIVVPLKYLSNVWGILEMSLINGKINLQLTWSMNCVITNSATVGTFRITSTKIYVSVRTLPIRDNAKLLQKSNLGFKGPISWNKYLTKNPSRNKTRTLIAWLVKFSRSQQTLFVIIWKWRS